MSVHAFPSCSGNCNQGRQACDCALQPAEAATEVGADQGEPVTGISAWRFWLVISAPAMGGVSAMALVVWLFKP